MQLQAIGGVKLFFLFLTFSLVAALVSQSSTDVANFLMDKKSTTSKVRERKQVWALAI